MLEVELLSIRGLLKQLKNKVGRMGEQADSDLAESSKLRSEYEKEIAGLRRENAELTKTLIKIKTIQPIL